MKTYYVTIKARRKDARRHISERFDNYPDALQHFSRLVRYNQYNVGLYTGDWKEIMTYTEREVEND